MRRNFSPNHIYRDPQTRETVDVRQKLIDGGVLSDNEMLQIKLNLDVLQYSAQTDAGRLEAAILEENIQNRIVENILNNTPITEDGLFEIYGTELYPEEAELAVTLDIEHFWEKEYHLRPEEIQKALKDFAIEAWNFAYGDDIQTVLDNEAHPLARVWAGLQLLPALKVTKLAKIGKFSRFFQKAGDLGANPFKGKTPTQIHKMLTDRKFTHRATDFRTGSRSYINPKTNRSYNIDINRKGGEHLHVDANYRILDAQGNPVPYNRTYFKKKYGIKKRKYGDVIDD